jgi:hypothetical protein
MSANSLQQHFQLLWFDSRPCANLDSVTGILRSLSAAKAAEAPTLTLLASGASARFSLHNRDNDTAGLCDGTTAVAGIELS